MFKQAMAALIIMFAALNCCGCWNLIEVNNTAPVAGLGMDVLNDGQMHFSVQLEEAFNPGEGEPVKAENIVLTSRGQTITEAARNITLFTPRFPLWSHATSLVIGEKLARDDLAKVADFVLRNRNIRMDSTMLVANDARPDQVFAVNDPLTGTSARSMEDLLNFAEAAGGSYVAVSASEFFFKLATPGVDPVLPMLRVTTEPGKALQLEDTAVFRERRMVGVLDAEESRGYRWMNPVRNMGGLLVTLMPDQQAVVTFEAVKFTCRQIPRLQNGQVVMDIKINVLLNMFEQQGTSDLVGLQHKEDLEEAAAREIKHEVEKCIAKAQLLGSDILGWGQAVYRYHPKQWESLESKWYQIYPQVQANIKVNCRVDRTYLSSKSFEFK